MSSSDSDDDPQECPLCPEDAPVELPAYETWLQCDVCAEWYHGVCVGISASECECIDKFHCKRCMASHGPSSYRATEPRRSQRPHSSVDYTKLNEGQPATFNQYKMRLDAHEFMEDEFEHLADGREVTAAWIRGRDSNDPFIVEEPAGLGMVMPAPTTTVADIAEMLGRDMAVSVMDVLTQEELSGWTLGDWADYFGAAQRQRILNVISLEVSGTALDDKVRRPQAVDDVDLVEKYWPAAKRKPNRFPRVKTYCLMGVQNAYTDFHVDFSATWVYYHVLSGEKVFYLVPPTSSNMRKFESWSKSPEQAVSLFAESVKQCFKVRVRTGNTLFIPAGWIHAVFTPVDTLVIGGNFLVMQSLNTHIGAYKLEARTRVPTRYRFPFFLKLCRYMAELLARKWRRLNDRAKAAWSLDELEGAFVLAAFLEAGLTGEGPDAAATARALGDRDALKGHVGDLLELVGAELGARMTPNEWTNREQQLREGCHYRWVRPGMPQQASLLLAARPRRSRAAGEAGVAGRSITAIRKKAAARAAPPGLTRLVRGRPEPGAARVGASGLAAALGTGTPVSDDSHGGGGDNSSDGSDTSSRSDSDAEAETGDDDGGGDDSGSSSDDGSFVVSDSDSGGRNRRPQKRRSAHIERTPSKRAARPAPVTGSRPQNARQRIAERLKIKL